MAPSSATTYMLAIIMAIQFFVRTGYGVSSSYYNTTAQLLILGVLQGSGDAPCIGLAVCQKYSVLTISKKTSQKDSLQFVQNTSILLPSGQSLRRWHRSMAHQQFSFRARSGCFNATNANGGSLALQKRVYCLVTWEWDHHRHPTIQSNSASPDLSLPMSANENHHIPMMHHRIMIIWT